METLNVSGVVHHIQHRALSLQPACGQCSARALCVMGQLPSGKGAAALHKRRLAKDQTLYAAGARANDTLYMVRLGSLKKYRSSFPAPPRVSDFFLPGQIVALDAIGSATYDSTVVALEDSEVCSISLRDATTLIPQLHLTVARETQRECNTGLLLHHTSADQRLAAFLLQLAEHYGQLGYSNTRFRLSMARRDIADYLGLSAESISRTLLRLEQKCLLQVSEREVTLLHPAALAQLASPLGLMPPPAMLPAALLHYR
ncbi:MAG: helix-turn-helix domain-containing protein [Sphingomonadaceae bacterium]